MMASLMCRQNSSKTLRVMTRLRRTGHLGMSEEARQSRRRSIGGSDARIIMSGDQDAIEHLWRQKRGYVPLDDLSDVLLVQMGVVMEPLVLDWFEFQTGLHVFGEQTRAVSDLWEVATCTLDGLVAESEGQPAIGFCEAKFMMPFRWTLDGSVQKYQPQFQWNSFVTGYDRVWFPVVTGAAVFAQVEIEPDPLYQACMLSVAQDFWRCVETGKVPGNPKVEPPPVEALRVVDMSLNNHFVSTAADWLEFKSISAKFDEVTKTLKSLVPADAKEVIGGGVVIKKAKNGRMTILPEACHD